MSNAIRYDALLVRDLAAGLDRSLAGARLDGAWLERDRLRVALRTRAARRRAAPPPSLLWQLHPASGHLTTRGADTVTGGQVQLATPTRIRRVTAPPDERIIDIELDGADASAGTARRIIIELITNQWNAVALGADDRIVAVLRERDARDRSLRAGVVYLPPRGSGRIGAAEPVTREQWLDVLEPVPPGERLRALLRFAWTSPFNAAAILGTADVTPGTAALLQALERYLDLVWRAPRAPAVVHDGELRQPYSVPIGSAAHPAASLLDAFDRVAELQAAAPGTGDTVERALTAIAERLDAAARRIDRLRAEHDGAAQEAARMRQQADLLLAQLQRVPRGAAAVELDDFAGGTVTVSLDASLNASENARRIYDAARRRDRAAARVPRLIAVAEQEMQRLESLAARVRDGTATDAELEQLRRTRRARGPHDERPALPYRVYRTSAGTEVRVGRGSKANDALTFRHSSPSDIWLHARDAAGAHVILRWPHADANPAARDIEEAATLAAMFSRARTSGLVPVDWTRRRHVRKPRKAPPGLVLPERVRTVFVTPDAGLEEKLRADGL